MKQISESLEALILRGGYLAAAALLVYRLALLVSSDWSAWASPGSLLHTLLDILAAGVVLLMVIIPLRRGKVVGTKRSAYALALPIIKLSWSIADFDPIELGYSIIDVVLAAALTAAALGAWRLSVWRMNYAEEEAERAEDQ